MPFSFCFSGKKKPQPAQAQGPDPAPSAKESNPPVWPASVHVVEPDGEFSGDKQKFFDSIFTDGGKYQAKPWGKANSIGYGGFFDERGRDFDTKRVAVLLKPGAHKAKFSVGFYTSLIGLGRRPEDVELGAFECLNGCSRDGGQHSQDPGCLNNFWRSVENVKTPAGKNMYWFVSQASPLRKVEVQGRLQLCGAVGGGIYEWGYGSGGFTADCRIHGGVEFGGQQQYCTRNTVVPASDNYRHGAWNFVLAGCEGAYHAVPNQSVRATELPYVERIAEKPYIMFEAGTGKYFLMIPEPETKKKSTTWDRYSDDTATLKVDFENVYVADAASSTAATINAKIAEGKHVVLAPGLYKISEPIVVGRSGTVLLGLGMATVMPADDAPWMDSLIFVEDGVEGVRMSAVLLEAGVAGSDALLKWGTHNGSIGDNTGFLHDIFCRVGGDRTASMPEVKTNCMVQINSSNVVGDNLWLWRADHEIPNNVGVEDSRNKVNNALQVNGDGVSMYGLFCEHALQDQVVWKGEKGRTVFFQSEMPYDVTQLNFGDAGYVGYRVADHVKEHQLLGAGVYSYFRDHEVQAAAGFRFPPQALEGMSTFGLTNLFTIFLNGKGGIKAVVNESGSSTSQAVQGRPMWYD